MTDSHKPYWEKPFQVTPRLGQDKRQLYAEPEFRDVLDYIGSRLGLGGSFHLVVDVARALEGLLDEDAQSRAKEREQHRRLLEAARHAYMRLGVEVRR